MMNFFTSLYHLHIAKCGGTYLSNMLLEPLRHVVVKNGISYLDGAEHLGWKEVEGIYTVCSLRDPVKRIVSHYSYWRIGGGIKERSPKNPLSFLDWVETHKNFLSNYQVKNILFTRVNFDYDIFQPTGSLDPNFTSIEINKTLLLDRLSRINILLKDTQLNTSSLESARKKIKKDLILPELPNTFSRPNKDNKINKDSYDLYETLSPANKKYLYELSGVDSEIYFTEDFYFANKAC